MVICWVTHASSYTYKRYFSEFKKLGKNGYRCFSYNFLIKAHCAYIKQTKDCALTGKTDLSQKKKTPRKKIG